MRNSGRSRDQVTERIIRRYVQGELALAEALRQIYHVPPPGRKSRDEAPPPGGAKPVDAKEPQVPGRGTVPPVSSEELYREMAEELNQFVGLHRLKDVLQEAFAFAEIQKRRQDCRLKAESVVWHMIFRGNPGTGKTTMARFVAKWLHRFGILSKGQLIEVERADLVGEYIGHTAQKTREQIQRALGGVLFVDEAYALARGGSKDFGREAVDTLVKAVEDHRSDLVVILAGYPREMDAFLRLNPGLPSRFPIQLAFDDYTVDELMTIADRTAAERDYRLSPEARRQLASWLSELTLRKAAFGNARLVRNLLERAIRRQARRLVQSGRADREALITLRVEDFVLEVEKS
ncbi:MAG: AAA family ATPase [Kyrpidia sp.]|nr:AAA family ATPase [Kyrpidia sp.]